jgi:7-carboxy-7-deazaguanine synthase
MTSVYERGVREFPVVEIFGPTIQGEGELIGIPTLFVRFGGCDYRCSWCDSLHAVLPQYRDQWEKLTAVEIVHELRALAAPPYLVTLSGGNPALHPLGELVALLKAADYLVAVETQGSKFPAWLMECHSIILSPKPPSSGEAPDLAALREYLGILAVRHPWFSIKVVVFDDGDLAFADAVRQVVAITTGKPLVLQVGNPDVSLDVTPEAHREMLLARYTWLAGEVLKRGWSNVRVLPQLHALAWSNARGV